MAKHSAQILALARRGAQHRYDELKTEIDGLIGMFPDLAGKRRANVSTVANEPASAETVIRKRSTMSAAAKKAVSVRMKKYWAARRKAVGAKEANSKVK